MSEQASLNDLLRNFPRVFRSEVDTMEELDTLIAETPPTFVFCEVRLTDAKMRTVPDGWFEVQYDLGIARTPWGQHEKAKPAPYTFDRDGEGSYFEARFYKVAVWQFPEHNGATLEVAVEFY